MRFPIFALLAPIVTSLVLWMVTKSPYTLLFALMGPVMAVASYFDARFGERRRQRHDDLTAENERADALAVSQREQARQRRERRHAHPAPGELAVLDPLARPPWNSDFASADQVRLGLIVSALGWAPREPSSFSEDLVPLLADAAAGIVCVGNPLYSLALARAIWMQLAWNVAPETLALHAAGYETDVLAAVGAWPVRLVDVEAQIPPAARYVIEILSPNEGRVSDRDDPRQGFTSFIPDYITAVEASAFSERLARTSRQIEQSRPGAQLPKRCTLGEVMCDAEPDRDPAPARDSDVTRSTLAAPVGVSVDGVLSLDLVAHGPHAVVAGMTGTGKTEFLVSWILSSALRYSPEEFSVLIIDFKGGSGFARVAALPHCMGIMTDLDVGAAQRALHSLRAELRFRERTLNEAGVTDFRDLSHTAALTRLVIVVDEYRALLDRFAELQPLFLDIAARGRALGIHLILGTQRATGVVADGILANCALRIVFRVNNVSDSMALLETDAARTLPEIPGRAALIGTSLGLTHLQVARATEAETQLVEDRARRWFNVHPLWHPRRPWLPELPSSISLAELEEPSPPAASLVLGFLDEPDEQRQSAAHYLPTRDGHLLVEGEQGSGKTTLLRLLGSQAQQPLSFGARNAEEVWDGLHDVADNTLVLIDDLEALMAEFTLEHRDVFLERLVSLLRTGPGRGIYLVIASQNGSHFSASWMSLMKSTLTLGATGATGPALAGRGRWKEHAIQIAQSGESRLERRGTADEAAGLPVERVVPFMIWHPGQQYVVVTPRPRLRIAELSGATGAAGAYSLTDVGRLSNDPLEVAFEGVPQVFVGDVEDWQSQFSLLARLRPHATFVFDDCSPSEVRAVRRSRDVLPHASRGTAISLSPEGVTSRVRLT